jgi:hypothetical protein
MTETTPATTPPSNDTINVLTALSTNEGTISLTINIQKDTARRLIYAAIAIVVICLALAAWTIYFLGRNAEALRTAAQEDRLAAAALDDKRLENRAAWRQLGVDGIALENHDISEILEQVRKKYPPKEGK